MAKKNYIGFIFDFNTWGINTSLEDYRLCQFLNKHLNWQLQRTNDIEISTTTKDNIQIFNTYQYINQHDFYEIELIQNKKAGNILIPELRNIDFLLLQRGETDYFDKHTFSKTIIEIAGIQTAMQIDIDTLKSRHNLLISHFNESEEKKNKNYSNNWPCE